MILVVETPIDLANYLDVALVRQKHPTPNVFHLSWSDMTANLEKEPPSKQGRRKLYITGHGSGTTISKFGPNDLGARVKDLVVTNEIEKIILLSCSSGKQEYFGMGTGVSTYCKVFSDKLTLDTHKTFEVTGFTGTQVTPPGGHSRVVKDDQVTALLRAQLIKEAFQGTGELKEELKSWCEKQKPTSPEGLIKTAEEVYERYMKLVQNPSVIWPAIAETLKSKSDSKVHVNR